METDGDVIIDEIAFGINGSRAKTFKKNHSHPTGFERKGWSFWFAPATRQG